MTIIGVKLHTPTMLAKGGLLALSTIYIAITLAVVSMELADPVTAWMILVGLVSGTLAGACGCSVLESGLRGAIVTAGFTMCMMALCVAMGAAL